MNSRERILSAIEHAEPDRIPVDLGATPSSGISAVAYGQLKGHLGISEGHTRVYDVVQQLAQPEDCILDRLGVDVVDIGRTYNDLDSDWYDIKLANGDTAQYPVWFRPEQQADGSWNSYNPDGTLIAKMPAGGTFYDQSCFPYRDGYPADYSGLDEAMGRVLWQAMVHSPWDHAGQPDFWDRLRERGIELKESTDRAVMIVCGCNLFEWGTFLRRMDNFLMDVLVEQDNVEKLLDALMERHLAALEKVCTAVGDVADILRFGDDLGMDSGPFMPPDIYRRLFKPRHTILCNYVHKHSDMKTFLHSCGGIRPLLGDLVEAGYDIINPVQTNAAGMDAREIKDEFGADITFWGGGCDTRGVLNRATPEEVRADVLKRLEIFSPGGGYVFNPIHNILPEVRPENIMAMFEAVSEYGAG